MSEVAIFELDSRSTAEEIAARLEAIRIPWDIYELTDGEQADPRVGQSKKFSVGVDIYLIRDPTISVVAELQKIAQELLEVSDDDVYYYRSSHAQERDAEEEVIAVADLPKYPPTLHEPYTKRYVISKKTTL